MIATLLFLAATQELTIIYSADRRSEVAPCHCENNPLGGVDRQVATVAALRKPGPVLLLDGGDNFFANAEQADTSPAIARAELMADALAKMQPAVITPGMLDFARGATALRTLGLRAHANWLLSNVNPPAGQVSLFAREYMAKIGEQKILVLGFWSDKTMPPEVKKEGYTLQDPIEVAKRAVEVFGPNVDLIIAIAQTDGQTEEALAGIEGISLVLSAHEGRLQFGARQAGKGQIVSAGNSGKYMIRLDLRYRPPRPALTAGIEVQKFFRDFSQLRARVASITGGSVRDDMELRLFNLQQNEIYAKQSTLLFNLLPMGADIVGDSELLARAKALDPAGYEFSKAPAK